MSETDGPRTTSDYNLSSWARISTRLGPSRSIHQNLSSYGGPEDWRLRQIGDFQGPIMVKQKIKTTKKNKTTKAQKNTERPITQKESMKLRL